ncbi:MAG: response regulator [Spirochaetaceae bacterium]|jgi:putative two-component system response regulator|nr:response regulator [Spirochaetaceae bacterium]
MAKQILVVDDNLASLKQIGAQLESHYEVSLAKSGALALKICKLEKPDLILLDVEMPEMDGFETIAMLKGDPDLNPIPVIFLTGNLDTDTELRALESGAMDFITKPANKDILFHRLELHLQFAAYQNSLEQTVKELEESIVTSFAELIECKDDNAGTHVLRTGRYVDILGRKLLDAKTFGDELTGADLELMVKAAPFHDIGKIGVSDTLLLKEGALTKDEYDLVKRHPLIGARFLAAIYERTPEQHYLKFARLIAESHHERYDGAGYPRGLAGDAIPLCARIMAVANVYDGCITDRVYRKALSHEEACRVVIDGKDSWFDPRIVEVFEGMKDEFARLKVSVEPLVKIQGKDMRHG